ncbi:MAG: prolyl oligopeptidase family serine peptidase [Alteraurantiacibacter sp.]
MGRVLAACALAFAGLAAAFGVNAQDAPPELAAYGQLPAVEDIAISPSGNLLAIVMTLNGQRQLAILDRNLALLRSMPLEDLKYRGLAFVGDESVMFRYSTTVNLVDFNVNQLEVMQAAIVPVDRTQPTRTVFAENRSVVNGVFGFFGLRETAAGWRGYFGAVEWGRTSFGQTRFDHGRPALYEVDMDTFHIRRVAVAADANHSRDWLVGPDGQLLALFDMGDETGEWSLEVPSGRVLASGQSAVGRVWMLGLGATGDSVLYANETAETGNIDWFEVPLAGGSPRPFLPNVRAERLLWSPVDGRLLGHIPDDAEDSRAVLHDPELQSRVRLAIRSLAERNGELLDWAGDFNRVLMHTSGTGDSGTWILMDLLGRSARELGYDRPRILGAQVGPVSVVNYTAGDGLDLDGVLTLPAGREARGLPLIVMPHGGPHAHDEAGFDWWAQAYASRGYAVFQPNFRGSTGRGENFVRAGFGQWGRLMQTDISDGVAYLAQQGTIDPARACIVGASYGGYAALAGVTVQQGLYRCAVAVAGVSDIAAYYASENREAMQADTVRASLREQLGPREQWNAVSPRRLAARADAPILLIHGRDDTVVAYSHSAAMADALRDSGKPVELVELADEDHWLSRSETRQQMLQATMDFVLEHNPPD